MAANHKNTNVKFNMDDPVQASAYEYLQKHKGHKSYSRLISEAIVEKAEAESIVRYENRDGEHILPDYNFCVTDEGLKLMSEMIADRIGIGEIRKAVEEIRLMVNEPVRNTAVEKVTSKEMEMPVPLDDAGDIPSPISEEMLAFACG